MFNHCCYQKSNKWKYTKDFFDKISIICTVLDLKCSVCDKKKGLANGWNVAGSPGGHQSLVLWRRGVEIKEMRDAAKRELQKETLCKTVSSWTKVLDHCVRTFNQEWCQRPNCVRLNIETCQPFVCITLNHSHTERPVLRHRLQATSIATVTKWDRT